MMNRVPKIVWLILGLLLLLQTVTLIIAINKPAGKSYPLQVQKIVIGPKGEMGAVGAQGQPGLSIQGGPGIVGPAGIQGPATASDQIDLAVSAYLQANPPAQGPQGPPGDSGADGKSVELRTNPLTGDVEWRYSGDFFWRVLLQACQLTNTCVSP